MPKFKFANLSNLAARLALALAGACARLLLRLAVTREQREARRVLAAMVEDLRDA